MATLFVRRVGSGQISSWLKLGGQPGNWVVSDGSSELATARMRLLRYQLHIDAGGRRFTAHIPAGMSRLGIPRALAVIDDATGHSVVDGKFVAGGRTRAGGFADEWTMTFPGRSTISWVFRPEAAGSPRRLGFYEPAGAPVMTLGHDPSFQPPAKGGTLRILLGLWAAAALSTDRYIAQLEDGAIGHLITPSDVPLLALLGVFMERTAESRYSSVR